MQISVDISMYPLVEDYKEIVRQFVDRIAAHKGITLEFGAMSTVISGECELVMSLLATELKSAFTKTPNSVFVTKIVHTACKA